MERANSYSEYALVAVVILFMSLIGMIFTGAEPAAASADPAAVPAPPKRTAAVSELIIKYKNRPAYNKEAFGRSKRLDVRRYHLQAGESMPEAIEKLKSDPEIEYIEPNYIRNATMIPNDPDYPKQWALASLNMEQAWDAAEEANAITVAVLDTGVDFNHPELRGKVLPGYSFVQPGAIPQDDGGFSHGTFVSAIIAANTNNALGMAGMTRNVRILPLKILDSEGYGTSLDVANAIYYAVDHGAKVINMSFGGPDITTTEKNAIAYALSKNVVLVAASGNEYGAVSYPAAYPGVIAVGATTSSSLKAGFSNYGYELDVVAPGAGIYSAIAGGGYSSENGTSFAAPHVSGLAALLLSENAQLTPLDVEYLLESSAKDLGTTGYDKYYGYGLIQPLAAIQRAAAGEAAPKDANESMTQAEHVDPGVEVDRTLAYPGDIDWYSFDVKKASQFRLKVDVPSPEIPKVTLMNRYSQVISDRLSNLMGDAVELTADLQPGTYYLRVQDNPKYQNFSIEPYTVKIIDSLYEDVWGTFSLENRASYEGITVTIPALGLETLTDEQGRFKFEGVVRGDYVVEAEMPTYLRMSVPHVSNANVPVEGTLLLGDLNQDGIIDLYDLVRVMRQASVTQEGAGVEGADSRILLDMNADGMIDIEDTFYIVKNFNRQSYK